MSAPGQLVNGDNVEFRWGKKRGRGGKNKEVQFYSSFTYDGLYYELYDCVYLCKDGEPEPYVGKIIKIWELSKERRRVKVLWFFRPCEIMNWLGDEQPLENELFLACGEGQGLTNINPLEAIAGKCNVVCISKDSRNPQPSEKDLQTADFTFYRMFDVQHHRILDKIDKVDQVQVEFIFNKKDPAESLGTPKSDMHKKISSGYTVRNETEKENGEHIAGKDLVNKVGDETKVSLEDSGELDNRPLKKAKVDSSTQLDNTCIESDRNAISAMTAEGKGGKALTLVEDEKKVKPTKVIEVVEKEKPTKVIEDEEMGKHTKVVDHEKMQKPTNGVEDGKKMQSKNINEKKVKPTKVIEDEKKVPTKVIEDEKTRKPIKDTKNANELDKACDKVKDEPEDTRRSTLDKLGIDSNRNDVTSIQGDDKLGIDSRFDMVPNQVEDGLKVRVEDRLKVRTKSENEELETRPYKKLKFVSSSKSPKEKKGIGIVEHGIDLQWNNVIAKKGEHKLNKVLVNHIEDEKELKTSKANDSSEHDKSPSKNSKLEGYAKQLRDKKNHEVQKVGVDLEESDLNVGRATNVSKDKLKSRLAKDSEQMDTSLLRKMKLDEKTKKLSNSKSPKTLVPKSTNKDQKLDHQIIEVTRRPNADRSRWFKGIPWEQRMLDAHKQGSLVLLENLDPTYTSAEVEDIVWHGFKESCIAARMVQRIATSSPISGQAFVILRTREAAEKVVRQLEEGCLMLSNGRPLFGCIGTPCFPGKDSTLVGHFALDKLKVPMQRDMKEAVSTSHCSQGNTIEYEMAMEWFLLQERSDRCWKKLYQLQADQLKRQRAKLNANE